MIDTVILTIPRENYKVMNPAMFQPNYNVLLERGFYLVKCVNNPTKTDKESNIYKPKLTATKRMTRNGNEIPLKIEFSTAKVLYKNNLDETEEKDFDSVIRELIEKLYDMGVMISFDNIKNASVKSFHPSKNIELKDYTTSFVIQELEKVNLSKRLDLNKADFRNTGESVQYYTNSYSFTFYDKVKDLSKQPKRAIDKDQTYLQSSLFEPLEKDKKQILRMEARLVNKVKLNSVLKNLGYDKNPKFKDIFKKDLCQKILMKCWNEFVADHNLFLFSIENNTEKIFRYILQSTKYNIYTRSTSIFALNFLAKELGTRKLRAILEERIDPRTWSARVKKDLDILNEVMRKQPTHNWIVQINKELESFKPYKINPP
jgi:hypothetical protein